MHIKTVLRNLSANIILSLVKYRIKMSLRIIRLCIILIQDPKLKYLPLLIVLIRNQNNPPPNSFQY